MVTKQKCDFEKRDLQCIKHPRVSVVKFVGPTPWDGIVARHEVFITCQSDLVLDFLIWDSNRSLVEYRLGKRIFLNWIHAKVGDRNLCILQGLFTIEVEMGMIDYHLKMLVVGE